MYCTKQGHLHDDFPTPFSHGLYGLINDVDPAFSRVQSEFRALAFVAFGLRALR